MPDQEFEYDVFLSHAGEDKEWCETLAERLRNEGVRVWFDKWKMQPGDNVLAKINDGLAKSRKMVAVWSANYFRDGKVWTLVESFSQLHGDPLSQDRPIIPLLIADCDILPTFRNILSIDFRNQPDFDLRFRELLQALDLPRREFERELDIEFKEHDFEAAKRGRLAQKKGKRFEDEIAKLYELLGFTIKRDTQLHGFQIDLQIEKRDGGLLTQAIVECKDKRLTADDRNQILAQQNLVQKKLPRFRWIALSSQSFAADTRAALEEAGVDCTTYPELLRELVPLDRYVENLVADYEAEVKQKWRGEDWYIRPNLRTEVSDDKLPALSHFAKWLGSERSNFLVLLGDLGTGKSTLARFLAYNLAKSFVSDPLRHPAPVLIPLKDVRKENSLESMIISHFSKAGLPGINFPRFQHLVRLGKIILLFDAFDEMADRVRWEVTKGNFTELRRAAEQSGKVLLTCRTHYFKDRNEQAKLIGVGPRLSEIETDLYRELKRQSGAEVVYLQEFDDSQIKAYLHKARPLTAAADWQKIQNIYNLKELAQRPLLLDMIVKSLPKLEAGQSINAASLYKIYTNIWIEREEAKGRILDKSVKMSLMLELAWRMWHEAKDAIHYRELTPFVEKLVAGKVIELGDEEADDIAREMQAATFLKRDDAGNFSFVHRSFMEYFLARKIYDEICTATFMSSVLNTRRFDRKIVYFLTYLDAADAICSPLQQILRSAYLANVSENALQILYWSGRIRVGMEEQVRDFAHLRNTLQARIPSGTKLVNANLQEIILEGAFFTDSDFKRADFTKANLNHAHLVRSNFTSTLLRETRAENVVVSDSVFCNAILEEITLTHAVLNRSDFTGATLKTNYLLSIQVKNCPGLDQHKSVTHNLFYPIVQLGHSIGVNSIEFSPIIDLVAQANRDGIVILYRNSDNKILRFLEGHKESVTSVHFSPDGLLIASGGYDNCIQLWEVVTGKQLRVFDGHQDVVNSVHFSPDGSILASGGSGNSIRLWEVTTGKQLRVLVDDQQNTVYSVRFSPNGLLLASGSADNRVRLWDISMGKVVRVLEGHKDKVNSVHFSPHGTMLASGSLDKTIWLWDVEKGKVIHILEGHTDSVSAVHFSPDGSMLVSGSWDKNIGFWNVETGKLIRMLQEHHYILTCVCFSPDGSRVASGGWDRKDVLWDVKNGKQIRTISGHRFSVTSQNFSVDGSLLASGSDDSTIRIWKLLSGNQFHILKGHKQWVSSINFSLDGSFIASGSYDTSVRLWDVNTGEQVHVFEGHLKPVNSVHFSPDNFLLASGSDDYSIRLWDVKGREELSLLNGHQGTVNSVYFSPDGLLLASGSSDNSIRLWDVNSRKQIYALFGDAKKVNSVRFSPDGSLLASAGWDKRIRLWDVKTNKLVYELQGHQSQIYSIDFSQNQSLLVSGSFDHCVRIWNLETGKCLQVLEGHLGPVYTVCFAPNGKYLVAAGAAGRLQFWDHEKGENLRAQPFLYRYAFGPGAWLDLLPDGRFDASPEGMRYLCYTEQGTLNSYTAEELVKEFYDPKAVQEVLEKYVK